jgi:hypothetical protein
MSNSPLYPISHFDVVPPRSRQSKYPFDQLKVGEYFEVPSHIKSISSVAYSYAKKHNVKFVVSVASLKDPGTAIPICQGKESLPASSASLKDLSQRVFSSSILTNC